jgi:hypothetical protein
MSLIYVGPNPSNDSGTSSKGYWIRRRVSEVRVTHGAIDIEGARGGRYFWRAGTTDRPTLVCRDVDDATEYVRRMIRDKRAGGYEPLPPRRKIEDR